MTRGSRWLGGLGASLFVLALLLIATGVLLDRHYIGTIDNAGRSTALIEGSAAESWALKFHYWGSAVMLVFSFLYVVSMLWAGWYAKPNRARWLSGLGLLGGALGFQLTGNLLPMDMHGVQTTVIEAGIASRVPIAGAAAKELVLGGDQFSGATIANWYMTHHWVLLGLWVVAIIMWLVELRRRDVPADWVMAVVPALVALILVFALPLPHSRPAVPEDFAAYDALPGWYVWPMHGSLALFESWNPSLGWIGAALIPGLFALFLVGLPAVGKLAPFVPRLVLVLFVAYFVTAGVLHGGSVAPISGERYPQESAPIVVNHKATAAAVQPVNLTRALAGQGVFNIEGCNGCHAIYGLTAQGGPNLTREKDKHPDLDFYLSFIKDAPKYRKGTIMPPYPKLTNEQLSELGDYIRNGKPPAK